MHIATSRRFRRLLTSIAGTTWAAAAALGTAEAIIGKNYPIHVGFLFCLSVAITSTVTVLVGGTLAPIEASFRVGYDAGFIDGHRQARPVVVPESRMRDMRENHAG